LLDVSNERHVDNEGNDDVEAVVRCGGSFIMLDAATGQGIADKDVMSNWL